MRSKTFFTADFEKTLVSLRFGICYIAIFISELVKSSQNIYQTKLFKVNCKGFNRMLFEFVLMLLLLALNKFLFPSSCCYVASTICQLTKSFIKNFGGVNFSLNKIIQNMKLKSVLKYIPLQKPF